MRVKFFRNSKEHDPYEWFKPKYKRIVSEALEKRKSATGKGKVIDSTLPKHNIKFVR
jgi:hypothetical protein